MSISTMVRNDIRIAQLNKYNLHLLNKDFRITTREEIPPESVDFDLVLDYPEPRVREDEPVAVGTALVSVVQ
jgi:hypothetical protein